MDRALGYAQSRLGIFVTQLQEYLRIPSISTLPEHQDDVRAAAAFIAADMARIGLQNTRVLPAQKGHPFVFGEFLTSPKAPTVLIYGHYDVQPVDPLNAWTYPPFSAEIHNHAIWARGASDNKAQHFAHLKAIECYLTGEKQLPLNVKILLEGEEESGSPNIEAFINAHKVLLKADFGIISDGAMFAPGQPELDYGLRGIAAFEILLNGPGRDLHSGSFGGTVLNPIQALTEILAGLHFPDGRVAVPGFYDDVRSLSPEERILVAATGYSTAQWQSDTGAQIPWGEPEFSLLERIGARPTLEINGIWGGYQGSGVKTVLPAGAGAKITMRLVPQQEPEKILQLAFEHIRRLTPKQVKLQLINQGGSWPALIPIDSPEMKAAGRVLEQVWGVPPVFNLGGGSLPVVSAFQRLLGVPFVLMPFGLDDNRHAPNEHIRLDYFEKGIETAIRFFNEIAG